MPTALPHSFPSPLAEYLADREKLSGRARENFLQLLAEKFHYRNEARHTDWRLLAWPAALTGTGALAADWWSDGDLAPGWLTVTWAASSLVALVLALALRPRGRREETADLETHWRVYCLLTRPVILVKSPGLLDRNLPAPPDRLELPAVRPLESLRVMLRERTPDLWGSGLAGLWAGMLAAAGWHLLVRAPASPWLALFPAAGLGLGPVAWALWQDFAYRFARRVARDGEKP